MSAPIVFGRERTGTSWASGWILKHPDVKQVSHLSWPTVSHIPGGPNGLPYYQCHFWQEGNPMKRQDGEWGEFCWLHPLHLDPEGVRPLVVTTRDIHCVSLSQEIQRGWDAERISSPEGFRNVLRYVLQRWKGPVTFLAYEAIVSLRQIYAERVLADLGLDPQKYPWGSMQYLDGNRKYVQHAPHTPQAGNEPRYK